MSSQAKQQGSALRCSGLASVQILKIRWLERHSIGFEPCIGVSPHIGLYFVSSMNSPAGGCLSSV